MIETLWAKKKASETRMSRLPLMVHLEDTGMVSAYLWENWLSSGQREAIISTLESEDDEDGKKLVKFLGLVHDIGKATPNFQAKPSFNRSLYDLDLALLEKEERAGFSGISSYSSPSSTESHHALAGEVILGDLGVNTDIGVIVGSHHGKPIDDDEALNDLEYYNYNYLQNRDDSEIRGNWKGSWEKILDRALDKSGFSSVLDLPTFKEEKKKSGQVLLSGLLIMADWISSNEDYFPLLDLEEVGVPDEEGRCREGFSKWFKTYPREPYPVFDAEDLYKTRFPIFREENLSPRPSQLALFEAINSCESPGIFILEAPCGSGKTEAALVGAEQLAEKTGRSGLYFGLPTQATSNGIFSRIEDRVESISKELDETHSIRLLHGKASLNEDFRSLATNIDQDGDKSVIVNQWFSGRKTASLDEFVVGTIDQFLLLSLKQKHLALRHLGFSKKVLVLDEVHAYNAFMSQYLYEALERMGSYGVPVIILSATLPAKKRKDMIKSYLNGRGISYRKAKKPEDGIESDAYPLITLTDGSEVRQVRDIEKSGPSQEVEINYLDDEDLLERLKELSKGGGVIGIIVNTVARSQKIARECGEIFGEDSVDLIHSNFIASERAEKEDDLISQIGKGGMRPDFKIIVGTQVLEQSLDIDFDCLFTDLAPIDLLIQRIGRLHRHQVTRPRAFENPKVYILGTSPAYDFEKGSQKIYGSYLLIKTQEILGEKIRIPEDVSPLVQKVYNDKYDPPLKGDQRVYFKEKAAYENLLKTKKIKASNYRLESPIYEADLGMIGLLANSKETTEEKSYAQVRDTDPRIEVIALKKYGEGYGFFRKEGDISGEIDDSRLARKLASETLTLPRIFSYNIDRMDKTIEHLEDFRNDHLGPWQNQEWLKGELGVIFDERDEALVNGVRLHYSEKYGLEILGKEDESEQV